MGKKREKELKQKIINCMASMVVSDNSITISKLQETINDATKELCAMNKELKQTAGEDPNE